MRLPLVPDLHPRLPTSDGDREDGIGASESPGEVKALKDAVGQTDYREPSHRCQQRPGWKLQQRARRLFSKSLLVLKRNANDTKFTFMFYGGCFFVCAAGYTTSARLIYGVVSQQPE